MPRLPHLAIFALALLCSLSMACCGPPDPPRYDCEYLEGHDALAIVDAVTPCSPSKSTDLSTCRVLVKEVLFTMNAVFPKLNIYYPTPNGLQYSFSMVQGQKYALAIRRMGLTSFSAESGCSPMSFDLEYMPETEMSRWRRCAKNLTEAYNSTGYDGYYSSDSARFAMAIQTSWAAYFAWFVMAIQITCCWWCLRRKYRIRWDMMFPARNRIKNKNSEIGSELL